MSLYGTLATALSCASSTRRPQGRGGFHPEERITTSLEPLGGARSRASMESSRSRRTTQVEFPAPSSLT
jgi:hypothetical protein